MIICIVVLETRQSHVVLAFYVLKTKYAFMLNLAAKKHGRRAGLHFDQIHEKLYYPKRFTDNNYSSKRKLLLFG